MRHSLFGWVGGAAAVVIIVASVIVRASGPADPAADVGGQRAAVERFYDLVADERWDEVFEATTEPPAKDREAFRRLMDHRVRKQGKLVDAEISELRLLRSRTVPFLEVHETLRISKDGKTETITSVSYFARRGNRWLFAFSAND